MDIIKFEFEHNQIEFQINKKGNVIVNATELAKIFNKDVYQYTRIDSTKYLLSACLKPQFCGLLNVENEEDLILSKQKSGTWMHRVVALDFASWLSPELRVWMLLILDKLIFGEYRKLIDSFNQTVNLKTEIKRITQKLRNNEDYQTLQRLKRKKSKITKSFNSFNPEIKSIGI